MNVLKSLLAFSAILVSLLFTNSVTAAETGTTATKESTRLTSSTVETESNTTVASDEQRENTRLQTIDDTRSYYRKLFEERRRESQEARQEAYKQILERRKQYAAAMNPAIEHTVPVHIQEKREQFLLEMEERRAYNEKLMDEYRKVAEERRRTMQLKMDQTRSACGDVKKV